MTTTQNQSHVPAAIVEISSSEHIGLYADKKLSFQDDLPESWSQSFAAEGKNSPTPIQEYSFHPVLDGHDLLAQSMTGSGKTLAFSLPLAFKFMNSERPRPGTPKILILTPTRELADQITQVFTQTLRHSQLRVTSVIGGVSYGKQEKALSGQIHAVVGTPGRVSDFIRKKKLNLSEVQSFVLDEVDQMLDTGFEAELDFIRQNLPEACQTLFFSATLNAQARNLAAKFLKHPVTITSCDRKNSPECIEHGYIATKSHLRTKALISSLAYYHPEQAIIFCETKKECSDVSHALTGKGFSAAQLNSDLNQYERQMAISQFKAGSIRFLIATNVAARGIDVQGLPMVINYTPPRCAESYTHRAGRTGRAGAKGKAWTFVTPEDYRWYTSIIRQVRAKPEQIRFPDSHSFMKTIVSKEICNISSETFGGKNFSSAEMEAIDHELSHLTPEQHKILIRQVIASRVSKIGIFDPEKLQWHDFDLQKSQGGGRPRQYGSSRSFGRSSSSYGRKNNNGGGRFSGGRDNRRGWRQQPSSGSRGRENGKHA
ncbi:MAG: DEAD/DEAH box helicase [Deltaproteobacteria bacterium]|nr:DEAD/DEAH box helicase [Deltaproteobacteria bacterium]